MAEKHQPKKTENSEFNAELLHKEMDLNLAEQNLLNQRLLLLKSQLNSIPDFDPEYISLLAQMDLNQIELDELKIRASNIGERLRKNRT